MTRFASEEALDCMLAYYKVSLKRFVDDIATEVIEGKLLSELPTLFTPTIAFDMSKDLVTQIADESEESQSHREQLNKKLWILMKGSDTCRRFVGIRGLDLHDQVETNGQREHIVMSNGSYSKTEPPEEAMGINSESDNEQPRPCSPAIPDQDARKKDDHEQHVVEPQQQSLAHVSPASIRRKKKKERLNLKRMLQASSV